MCYHLIKIRTHPDKTLDICGKDAKPLIIILSEARNIMLKILNEEISGNLYLKLIQYLCDRCDRISFHIPDYSNFGNRNQSNYDFEKVIGKIRNDFPDLFYNSLGTYRGYYDSGFWKTNVPSEIFVSSLSTEVMNNVLKRAFGIYDWIGPLFPEDLHFHSNGKCFLSVTSHEQLTLLYTKNKSDLMNIKNLGLVISQEFPDVSNDFDFEKLNQ